ncbi:MAG: matrixin family metalloprotease [Planctomycetota bacterium]|jgi:hypothetical protein
MYLTAAEITALAVKMLIKYRSLKKAGDLDGAFVPSTARAIGAGLEVLVNGDFLEKAGVSNKSQITLEKIRKAVGLFQKLASPGDGLLAEDGILGNRSLGWIRRLGACRGDLQHRPSKRKVPKPTEPLTRKIRWWFDPDGPDSLPHVIDGDAENLLRRAWVSWILVADLDILKATKREGANVIVGQADIDRRRGGTLADAHVGPPDGMVRELRFDVNENPWTPDKFLGTAAHEIGHLLGLRHAPQKGLLMSPLYQEGVVEPRGGDITALAGAGWTLR